ncbi:MAG: hypothetical protein M3020_07860 [Myxococcota bacterium]|nr:hypothetical protein [Myxococcota bacterium]
MLRVMGCRRPSGHFLRSLCIGLALSTAACSDEDGGGSGAPSQTRWSLVFEDLDSALISVTGRAADDVWTVGANSGDGATMLHFDGAGWKRIPVEEQSNLWWVHLADSDLVVSGGEHGTILRGNEQDGFERDETPGTSTVYGIFGSPGALWAVGGDDTTPGFVWRDQGDGWKDVSSEISDEPLPAVFKVWGASEDDVWFVGMDGLAVHWDGAAFERVDSGTTRRLFTVHGTGQGEAAYVAVGGFGSAVIVENDGAGWHDATPEDPPNQLYGVSMASGELGYAVGEDGAVVSRSEEGWVDEATGFEIQNAFHSVWVDPDGGVWAVGGEMIATLSAGMLLHGDPSGVGPEIPNQIDQ